MTSLWVDSCVMRFDSLPVSAAIVRGTRICPAGLRSRGVNGQVFAPAAKHTRRTPSVSVYETCYCAGHLGALFLDMLQAQGHSMNRCDSLQHVQGRPLSCITARSTWSILIACCFARQSLLVQAAYILACHPG